MEGKSHRELKVYFNFYLNVLAKVLAVISKLKSQYHHFIAAAAEADFRSHAEAQELGVFHEAVLLQHGIAVQRVPFPVGRPRVGDLGRGATGRIAGRRRNY